MEQEDRGTALGVCVFCVVFELLYVFLIYSAVTVHYFFCYSPLLSTTTCLPSRCLLFRVLRCVPLSSRAAPHSRLYFYQHNDVECGPSQNRGHRPRERRTGARAAGDSRYCRCFSDFTLLYFVRTCTVTVRLPCHVREFRGGVRRSWKVAMGVASLLVGLRASVLG